MTIHEMRCDALTDDLICKLVQTSEAYSEINTLFNIYPDLQDIAEEMTFLADAYYWLRNNGESVEIESVIQDYYVKSPNSRVSQFIQAYCSCKIYADKKRREAEVLTAVDIMKINRAVHDLNDNILYENSAALDYMPCIDNLWQILHELYSPKKQYHILLETAISFFRFITFTDGEKINVPAISLLLSGVLGKDSICGGLTAQWVILTDLRKVFSPTESEEALIHILNVFERMWRVKSETVYSLEKINENMIQKLNTECPVSALEETAQLLTNKICLRIDDVKSELNVSFKTAADYLKRLEQSGILHSEKIRRNRFYFNNMYCDVIKNMAEKV